MGKDARRQLGQMGEEWAARLLVDEGLAIVARNWRCAYGELDLVAHEVAPAFATGIPTDIAPNIATNISTNTLSSGETVTWLVAVEVRIRRGYRFGTARASVGVTKQAKLRTVAAAYVQAVGWQGPWRIDVVAIQLDGQGRLLEVAHLRHAVTG